MINAIYSQLARTNLLPKQKSSEILAGNVVSCEDIIMPLVIGAMDCEAVTNSDSKSTWTERRLARQCLIVTFLLAIVATTEQSA